MTDSAEAPVFDPMAALWRTGRGSYGQYVYACACVPGDLIGGIDSGWLIESLDDVIVAQFADAEVAEAIVGEHNREAVRKLAGRTSRDELAGLLLEASKLFPIEKPEEGGDPGWLAKIKADVRGALARERSSVTGQ